eukprot:GABV01008540.1.p2 GENE.GABV01008540.1~~GABV01008540.1.p2  ORF type:complete len:107 (+),score=31.86 GABV01008540.1:204-524(+)
MFRLKEIAPLVSKSSFWKNYISIVRNENKQGRPAPPASNKWKYVAAATKFAVRPNQNASAPAAAPTESPPQPRQQYRPPAQHWSDREFNLFANKFGFFFLVFSLVF